MWSGVWTRLFFAFQPSACANIITKAACQWLLLCFQIPKGGSTLGAAGLMKVPGQCSHFSSFPSAARPRNNFASAPAPDWSQLCQQASACNRKAAATAQPMFHPGRGARGEHMNYTEERCAAGRGQRDTAREKVCASCQRILMHLMARQKIKRAKCVSKKWEDLGLNVKAEDLKCARSQKCDGRLLF